MAKKEFGTGSGYFERKDWAGALPHMQAACDGGIAAGCYNAGQLYDEGLGVAQDKPTALRLFDQGCAGGVMSSCVRAGKLYAGGGGVPPDRGQQVSYFSRGCKGAGNGAGKLEGCELWAMLEPGADVAWVSSQLVNDPNVGSTHKEQTFLFSAPTAIGKLCAARPSDDNRACFVLRQTIEDLHFADVVGDPDHHFSAANLQPVQSALRAGCSRDKSLCRVSYMVDYAIVHNFGPSANDPTKCIRITGTYTTTTYYWVDKDGRKTFADREYSPNGTDVQNDCSYAIEYADFAGGVALLHPHEIYRGGLELNEILLNSNNPKIRYVRRR